MDLTTIKRPVFNINISEYTGLILDAGEEGVVKSISPSKYPFFNFHTDNIEDSYTYVKELRYKVESEIVYFEDFSYFNLSDLDNNIIAIREVVVEMVRLQEYPSRLLKFSDVH
ncbi:VOC family protein [Alkalicoccobacillus porphyridii]|uniref:VOC family protein n=1 Tax=Alkalicoccobacillus porphyridii TaxID=2597270 RepID=A0A553ZWU6_9BACI|nr:VOC family protein [Alkalicoccobacillus porphyridii]TSB45865.1 VOC family protein [Alkalicoccobacillus porphyridii]